MWSCCQSAKRWYSATFGPGSLGAGIVVLTTTAIGTGVLALPYVLSRLGWLAGCCAIVALGLLNAASLEALLEAGEASGARSYAGLLLQCGRPRAAWLLDLTVAVDCLGAVTAYWVFVGHLLPPLLLEFLGPLGLPPALAGKPAVLPALAALAFLAALPRSISLLGGCSLLGPCSILYVSALLAVSAMVGATGGLDRLPALRAATWPPERLCDTASALSVIMFSYVCQFNIFGVSCELERPTRRDLQRLARWSTAFQMVCYLSTAICGYLLFGEQTADDIFLSFAPGNVWVDVGRLLVCSSLCIAIPLNVFPARGAIVGLTSGLFSELCQTQAEACAAAAEGIGDEGHTPQPSCMKGLHRVDSDLSGPFLRCGSCGSLCQLAQAAEVGAPALGEALLAPKVDGDVGAGEANSQLLEVMCWEAHAGMAAAILTSTVTLAFLVPSVSLLMGVVGGFCGVLQMYVLPGLVLRSCPGLWGPARRLSALVGFATASAVGFLAVASALLGPVR